MQTSMQLADCMLFDSHLCTYRCMCNVYDLYVCCKRCLILGEAPRLWIRCCLSTTHMQYVILLARVAASSNFSLLGWWRPLRLKHPESIPFPVYFAHLIYFCSYVDATVTLYSVMCMLGLLGDRNSLSYHPLLPLLPLLPPLPSPPSPTSLSDPWTHRAT